MRGDVRPKGKGSLHRTLSTAMIIAGFIAFAAMFFPLQKNKPTEADPAPYYLPWCLVYGIICLAIAGLGVAGLLLDEDRRDGLRKAFPILGIASGGLVIIMSLPIIIVWSHFEFFISLALIGGCLLAIAILSYKEFKDFGKNV